MYIGCTKFKLLRRGVCVFKQWEKYLKEIPCLNHGCRILVTTNKGEIICLLNQNTSQLNL